MNRMCGFMAVAERCPEMVLGSDEKGRYVELKGFDFETDKVFITTDDDGRLFLRPARKTDKKKLVSLFGNKLYDKFVLAYFFLGEYKSMKFLNLDGAYYQIVV